MRISEHKTVYYFILLVPVFLTVACSSLPAHKKGKPIRDPQVVTEPDRVSLMLAEAADKASTALETLAAVEQSKAPGIAAQPIHDAPPELTRAMTLTWVGPPEDLLRLAADRASYTFLTVGDAPPTPLVVTVDAQNETVIDILRDVGLQLGVRADVRVDSTRRMVELHYAPTGGLGR